MLLYDFCRYGAKMLYRMGAATVVIDPRDPVRIVGDFVERPECPFAFRCIIEFKEFESTSKLARRITNDYHDALDWEKQVLSARQHKEFLERLAKDPTIPHMTWTHTVVISKTNTYGILFNYR